jgi:formiminotetrahydrofolate cyclodeaminase
MVAALPKSRAATAEDVARLRAAGDRCVALSAELEMLVDGDSDAYELVMAAYKKPKATDDEKAARSAGIQAALREAIAAPLAVMRACAAAAEQGVVIAGLGNPAAWSDAQVGFELLGAALRGAKLNVETNLQSVKDGDYRTRIRGEVDELDRAIGHETEAARRAQGVV